MKKSFTNISIMQMQIKTGICQYQPADDGYQEKAGRTIDNLFSIFLAYESK